MLHHTMGRVYSNELCIIIEDFSLLIRTCTKKKKKHIVYMFILHSSLSTCIDVSICFIMFIC